jgi:ferritin-like metal-binding protein YciE
MAETTFRDLYIDELKDIYNAEQQLIKALPKMAKAANSEELREGFEGHLEQTRGHAQRLEQIFKALGEKPTGKKCKAMEGLVEEGDEVIHGEFEGEVKDSALIAAAQRVEHYEIAAYGSVRAFAEVLGESDAVELLSQTLDEEKQTNDKLTELSGEINTSANEAADSDEEADEKPANRNVKSKAARA